ncbi:MAG TPA: NUDIX domain-containing protein [Thermomicrobiaceae bacterium]|nr:NUDIX domain-containing protein [Thermomicrobiaceae bacterium]
MAATDGERPWRNVTAVGGIVVRDESVLLVRLAYGGARGRYLLPGGIVDPGETLDEAVTREVDEETGVAARPLGIVGVRTRHDPGGNDTYVMFLMEHLSGEPRSDGRENDDARYFSRVDLEAEADVITPLSRYMALRALGGECAMLPFDGEFDYGSAVRDPAAWRLFR